MDKETFQEIKKSVIENYDGNVELGIAAFVYTPGVVAKCGNQVPPFADKRRLNLLKGQYTKHLQNSNKAKQPKETK